jgi:hypothetical protein
VKSKRTFLIVLAVLGVALASFGIAYAITNGEPDWEDHPYVGLIVFDVGGGPAWSCSGALVSPTVFLTAGHCTDGAEAARVWFESEVTDLSYPFGGGRSVEAAEIHTHPDFCIGCGPGLKGFDSHDVGVVVLTDAVLFDEYAALPDEGLVDGLAMMTDVDLVGYGVQSQHIGGGPPYWVGELIRYFAASKLVASKNVHSAEFIKLTANPAQGKGGTCFGDSGGPDLLGGTNVVLALNSYVTNYNCKGVTYSNRIDTAYALEFIQGFMED